METPDLVTSAVFALNLALALAALSDWWAAKQARAALSARVGALGAGCLFLGYALHMAATIVKAA